MLPTDTSQADPKIVALMYGIKQQESKKGNYNAIGDQGTAAGAGQWSNQPNGKPVPLAKGQIPSNFINAAKQYGLNPNDFSPENQNKVLYSEIAAGKQLGRTPEQILSAHNSGDPNKYLNTATSSGVGSVGAYNVSAYVKGAMSSAQQYAQRNKTNNPSSTANQGNQPQTGITGNESPLQAGINATLNTPSSALNFVNGALQAVNPINIANTIGQIGTGFQDLQKQQGTGQAIWNIIKGLPQATYETLVPTGVRSLLGGDIQGASKDFQEDPFGQAAPLVLAAEGGAKLADKYAGGNALAANKIVEQGKTFIVAPSGEIVNPGAYSSAFNKVVETIARPFVDTAGKIARPFVDTAGKIAKVPMAVVRSVVSHLTGLDPQTISAIVDNPASFSKLKQEAVSRGSVAEDFGKTIDQFIADKEATGKEYQPIREQTTPITLSKDFVYKVLNDAGIKIKDGKLSVDTNSITRNPADVTALQNFYDNWGNKKTITANEFLNMRKDLADLAHYDKETGVGKTAATETIAKKMRVEANNVIRPQIKGLAELDARVGPQIEYFKQLKKDFLNSDGTFKDGAPNKIANATGLGKEKLLSRMEQISPGITKSIQVLKAIEDIQKVYGIKVGTYARGVVGGIALTGNVGAIIGAIITHPTIAVPLLRGYGFTSRTVIPILQTLEDLTGSVNKPSTALRATATVGANQQSKASQ